MEKFLNKLKHYLIPNEKNNFRARAIHHDFLTFYLFIAFFISIFLKNSPFYLKNVLGFATDITIEKLYSLTNQERAKQNLPALTYNEKLTAAAAEKGHDMFAHNYWAHYSPLGKTPWDFIMDSGYKYEYAGENLAKNFLFSSAVVDAWMKSPSHKDNLLKKDFTDVGFAVVNGVLNGEETTLVVQMFGKPMEGNLSMAPKTAEAAEKIVENQIVLAKATQKAKINLFNYSFDMTYIFIAFLILVFVLDFFFAARLNIFRINGKSIAHVIFLVTILVAVAFIIAKSGAIV